MSLITILVNSPPTAQLVGSRQGGAKERPYTELIRSADGFYLTPRES